MSYRMQRIEENISYRMQRIEENYKEALQNIQSALDDNSAPELRALTKFFMETDISPYNFLPDGYAGGFNQAEGLSELISVIHHALYDDGDISFPIVSGDPRISFISQHEPNYKDYVLTPQEKLYEQRYGPYKIEFATDVYDFIEKVKSQHVDWLKKCFIKDVVRFGSEYTKMHYRTYLDYSESWENDLAEEILEKEEMFEKAGIKLEKWKTNDIL